VLQTNSFSGWEHTFESCCTYQFSLRMATDPAGSRYGVILFPAAKGLWRPALPTIWLSGREEIFQSCSAYKFCYRPGKEFEVLWYAVDMSLTEKTSYIMELPINSVSGWEHELEFCTIQQFSLRPAKDLVVLCYPLIPLHAGKLLYRGLRPTSNLTSGQRIRSVALRTNCF